MKADFLKQYDENKRDEETTENTKKLIEHAPEYVEQAKNFFQQHFIWLPGEYTIVVNIQTDQDSSNISKAFNFILFETQSDQLKKITEEYKLRFHGFLNIFPVGVFLVKSSFMILSLVYPWISC